MWWLSPLCSSPWSGRARMWRPIRIGRSPTSFSRKNWTFPSRNIRSKHLLRRLRLWILLWQSLNKEAPTPLSEMVDSPVTTAPQPVKQEKPQPTEEEAFLVVDELPEFPQGGINGLMRYLTQHIRYPLIAQKNRIQGRVLCQFIVNADGSIADVQVLSGVHPALNTEAQRVLRVMPRWKPGKREGKPVRVRYTLPVEFRLQ